MIEMRREKRWPAQLHLEISSLFKQDNVKAGIGFKTESVLPTGYYFNARLELGGDSALNCVVRILRQQDKGDYFVYGCEIVGAAAIMDYVVNDYAATLQ